MLIDKLEYYGIRGIAQEWLKRYLKDRKQFVQIDECASTLLSVTCGVDSTTRFNFGTKTVYIVH